MFPNSVQMPFAFKKRLQRRLRKFSLNLEPTKTKLVEFGRFAHRHAGRKRGRKRPETDLLLGDLQALSLHSQSERKLWGLECGTEKSRLRRALTRLQDQMRRMRHSVDPGTGGESSQSNAPRSLRILRRLPEIYGHCCGCIGPWSITLAQNTEQSELARNGPMGAIPADQGSVPAA